MAKLLQTGPKDYVLKHERESSDSEKTIWKIRPLTFKEKCDIRDSVIRTEINMGGPKTKENQTGVMAHLSGTQERKTIYAGLVAIENLKNEKDETLLYNQQVSQKQRDQILDLLPTEWTKEIADEILVMSGLTEEEEKN